MSGKEAKELQHLADLRRVLLGAERLKVEYLREENERLKKALAYWECEHVCLGDDGPLDDPDSLIADLGDEF